MQLTLAEAASADEAARAFAAGGGIRAGSPSPTRINGLPAVLLSFSATSQNGQTLEGGAAFIEHRGNVYQILGYAAGGRWRAHSDVVLRAVESFDEVTDPDVIGIEPWHIEIVRLDRAMTIEEFARRYPGPVDAERLALINGVEPGTRLEAGRLVKRVVGEALTS